MTIRLKLIALAALASVSFSSMAKVEVRELRRECKEKQGRSVVVEKRSGQHRVIITRSKMNSTSNRKAFYQVFLHGDSFGVELNAEYWLPSATFVGKRTNNPYIFPQRQVANSHKDLRPQSIAHGADEAMIFMCNTDIKWFGGGHYVELDISADIYESLIAQPWLSM